MSQYENIQGSSSQTVTDPAGQTVRGSFFKNDSIEDDESFIEEPVQIDPEIPNENQVKGNLQRMSRHDNSKKVDISKSSASDLEFGIIGAILADNNIYEDLITIIRIEDFSDSSAKRIFATIVQILEGDRNGILVADAITVGNQPGIANLISIDELQKLTIKAAFDYETVRSRAVVLHEAGLQRELEQIVAAADELIKTDCSVEDKSKELATLIEKGSTASKKVSVKSAADFAMSAVEKLAEQAQSGQQIPGIPTGFSDLDLLLAGLQPGQLIVIAARPGVGKTAFALSILLNIVEKGYPGWFVSLEMKGEELSKRTLSHISGVEATKVRLAAMNEDEWGRIISAAEHLRSVPMNFNDETGVTLSALRSTARKEKKAGRLSALFVDYLQIMETNANFSRERQISELSRGLKLLAMELEIPIIALSQLSRDIEKRANRRPLMSDLRESGAIEQDADVILFIDSDTDDLTNSKTKEATIIIGKQRSGECADVKTIFDKSTTRFHDIKSYKNNSIKH